MERWQNKVAVVTGASSGIGAACVKALVFAGFQVVGLARREERIRAIQDGFPKNNQKSLYPIKCDITDENEVNKAFEWTTKNLGGIDVLINNAGVIKTTQLINRNNSNEIRQTINTNLMGVVHCTREAFHSMKERNVDGHIVIINSIAGHHVPNLGPDLPSLNIYPATKFALRAMTETYRQEFMRNHPKVRITSVSPGIVDTEILPDEIQGIVKQFMPMLKCEDVADAVLYAIRTPPNVQVHNIIVKPLGEKF